MEASAGGDSAVRGAPLCASRGKRIVLGIGVAIGVGIGIGIGMVSRQSSDLPRFCPLQK